MAENYNKPALARFLHHDYYDADRRTKPLPLLEELRPTIQVDDVAHLKVPEPVNYFWVAGVGVATAARFAVVGIDARSRAVCIQNLTVEAMGLVGQMWIGTIAGGGVANDADLVPRFFGLEGAPATARYFEGNLATAIPSGTATDGFQFIDNTAFGAGLGVPMIPPVVIRPGESLFIVNPGVNAVFQVSIRGYEYGGDE